VFETPIHPTVLMPHIRRKLGPGSVVAIPVAHVSIRVQVLPFHAGVGPLSPSRPSIGATFLVNTMVSHLEPLKVPREEGPEPFRTCPRCQAHRAPKPRAPEVLVVCVYCKEKFRW
jgi:hypothetical protein